MFSSESTHFIQVHTHHGTTFHRQLPTDQVHGLNTVGALVNLGDTRIADELFHAPLADVTVTTKYRLARHCRIQTSIRQECLNDGSHQRG